MMYVEEDMDHSECWLELYGDILTSKGAYENEQK